MSHKFTNIQQVVIKSVYSIFTATVIFYSGAAYAIDVNVATFVENLGKTIPSLMQLVTAIAYVIGMVLVIKGVAGLKEYGESRTSRMDHHGIKGPLILLFVGTALLYLPSSVRVGLSTFWSEPNPFAYVTDSTNDSWAALLNNVFLILQLIGTIAFIRGLIVLSHMGRHGQQGGFGKAMAHIIGGILLINMYQFLQVVFNTLAIG